MLCDAFVIKLLRFVTSTLCAAMISNSYVKWHLHSVMLRFVAVPNSLQICRTNSKFQEHFANICWPPYSPAGLARSPADGWRWRHCPAGSLWRHCPADCWWPHCCPSGWWRCQAGWPHCPVNLFLMQECLLSVRCWILKAGCWCSSLIYNQCSCPKHLATHLSIYYSAIYLSLITHLISYCASPRVADLYSLYMHCTENLIYVFPEMKLRRLVPISYGVPLWLQQNRQTDQFWENRSEIHECWNWET